MVHISLLNSIIFLAGMAFPFVAAIAIPIALAIFIAPAWRQNRIARRGAWALLAVVAACGLVGAPFIIYLAGEWSASFGERLRRDTLTEPRTIEGNVYPVGTRLQLDAAGHVVWGELPAPTLVNGLPLIGRFEFIDGRGPRLSRATLARASRVEGVPCAEGPIAQSRGGELNCRLSEDFEFLGYPLAATTIIVANPGMADTETWKFKRGTLARPLRMLGLTWPPGTMIKPGPLCETCLAAGKLRDASPAGSYVDLCLPQDGVIMIGNIEVHGVAQVDAGRGFFISAFCAEDPTGSRGYARYGSPRYRFVEIDADGKVVRAEDPE